MRFNVLIGGKAGQGPNILAHTLGRILVRKGLYVFYSRDYQSLIRGGHNFNRVTFSNEPVYSNDHAVDILIALDEETVEIHKNKLNKDSVVIGGKGQNMYFAGKLFKVLGIDFELVEEELQILERRYEENLKEAKKGYEEAETKFELSENFKVHGSRFFRNGGMGVAEGAINAGLDLIMLIQ